MVTQYRIAIYPTDASDEGGGPVRRGPGLDLVVDVSAAGPAITAVTVRPDGSGQWPPAALAEVDIRQAVALALRLATSSELADAPGDSAAHSAATPRVTPTDRRRAARRAGRNGRRGRESVPSGVPADVATTYWRLGSTAKLAEHYNVPHQIAREWIRTLRAGGKVPNPWRQDRRG